MPGCGTRTYLDPERYETSLRQARIELVITSRGEFMAHITWAELPHSQLLRCEEDVPRIGYLSVGFGSLGADAFREGLRDFGYVEGQNVLVEDGRAGEPGQLEALAAELIARKVEIIVCGGSQATRAALAQTKSIPIVTLSSNPVAD